MNLIIISLVSILLSIVLFIIQSKVDKEDLHIVSIAKAGIHGLLVGLVVYVLTNYLSKNGTRIENNFNTGKPTF